MGQNLRYRFGDGSHATEAFSKFFWILRGTGVLTHSHVIEGFQQHAFVLGQERGRREILRSKQKVLEV